MWKEFRDFITKGNVLDLAVGIIIGGAFGKIVSSLVSDLLMPIIGLFAGKINFTNVYFALDFKTYENLEAAKKASAPLLMYGNFLQAVFDFLIIGIAIFMLVKTSNKIKQSATLTSNSLPVIEPTTKQCTFCLSVIPLAAKKCAFCCSEQTVQI